MGLIMRLFLMFLTGYAVGAIWVVIAMRGV